MWLQICLSGKLKTWPCGSNMPQWKIKNMAMWLQNMPQPKIKTFPRENKICLRLKLKHSQVATKYVLAEN